MNRLRVKLFSPHVPGSAVPRFGVRAARAFVDHCDRTPGREVTVTGGVLDAAGAWLRWPVARFTPVTAEQLKSDPNAVQAYAALVADGAPAFDVLFLPHPWRSFPAGRLAPNPAPIVAYVSDLDFDDADFGSVTDACRQTAGLIARDCAKVVFASEGLRRRMCERYGVPLDRTAVVRPAATLAEPPANADALVKELGLPTDFVVCFEAAGRSAEEDLAGLLRGDGLPWPVVVLGGEADIVRRLTAGPSDFDPIAAGRLIRLPMLSEEAYKAVLGRARAVVSLTSSPAPFFDAQHLDAMALRKPLFCEAGPGDGAWEGGDAGLAAVFRSIDELGDGLRRIHAGEIDRGRLEAAERHARGRTEEDVVRELFAVFEAARETPPGRRIRFRAGDVACRERR
ncbi:MAG TPA: hypothetical protein VF170_05205, partial [Planctomycetaceae bacterium]